MPRSRPPRPATASSPQILTIAGKREREDALNELKSAIRTSNSSVTPTGRPRPGRPVRRRRRRSARHTARCRRRSSASGSCATRSASTGVGSPTSGRSRPRSRCFRGCTGRRCSARRGQIMGVTTLNMLRMEQQIDTLSPVSRKALHAQLQLPPYSTGETGASVAEAARDRSRGARQAGPHAGAADAKRFPTPSARCPEALGSNGSTSMGSVCASTLSLLNMVCLRAPVARIADGPGLRGRSTHPRSCAALHRHPRR